MASYKAIWNEGNAQIVGLWEHDKVVPFTVLKPWDIIFDDPRDPILVEDVDEHGISGYLLADSVRVDVSAK